MNEGRAEIKLEQRSDAFETGSTSRASKYPLRPCGWCNTQFRPKRESPLKPAEHCSASCRSAHWREQNKRGAAVFSKRIEALESRLSAIESTLKIK